MVFRVLALTLVAATAAAGSGLPPEYYVPPEEKTGKPPAERPEPPGARGADVFFEYRVTDVAEPEKPAVVEELIPVLKIRAAGLAKKSRVERGGELGDITVALDDCPDPDLAAEVLSARAFLEFRAVAEEPTLPGLLADAGEPVPSYRVDELGYVRFAENDWETFRSVVAKFEVPPDYRTAYTRPYDGEVSALLLTDDGMLVEEVRDAVFIDDPLTGPRVTFDLDVAGRQDFAGLTARHVGGEIAILFDDYIMYKGQVAERVEGLANVENVRTREEAEAIALLLRSGSLPARLERVSWFINGVKIEGK